MSAHDLLKSIELWEEAIRCLFMAGRQSAAIEMAEWYIDTNDEKVLQNYNLMCLMGEMKEDYTWFERAWEESGGKCAKAMRMLGRHYFFKNEFKMSIECYEKGLAINKLYPDTWFTLGCAYMKIENYKMAIYAFGSVISIDERQVEAWSNIAGCHITMKKYFEAVTCCEQALRLNKRAWKIWSNFILFSIETLQFYKAMSGISQLMRYNHLETINPGLIVRLTDCFFKRFV